MYGGLQGTACASPEAEKATYAAQEKMKRADPADSHASEIVNQLVIQEGSITYLSGMLERLRSKLYPVLLEQPSKDTGGCATAAESLSPFGEALRSHNYRIQSCTAEVEKLLQQLSV